MDDQEPQREFHFNVLAALLAWLLPGLGHWSLGYRRRACLIGGGVLGLFLAGLLVGGIDVVDRDEDFWWYTGQFFAGPLTPAINYVKREYLNETVVAEGPDGRPVERSVKPHPPLPPDHPEHDPDYRPAYTPSFVKVNEVGTLYTTLAGMLNLLAILDVFALAPVAARGRNHR